MADIESPAEMGEGDVTGRCGPKQSAFRSLGLLDQLLAVWIFLAMLVGILLGHFVPSTGPTLQKGSFVGVSIPLGMLMMWFEQVVMIAIGLLIMMYPILCKIKYETLHLVMSHRRIWTHIAISVVLNWILAPLIMVGIKSARRG